MSEPKVLLIDLSALFWAAWHSSGADLTSAAHERTLAAVRRCKNAVPGALVAVCCDSGRSFRRDLLPTYKANRPEKDHAVIGELDRTIERLRRDGEVIWAAPGLEADDVIATATATAVMACHSVVIATGDKDLYQLIDDDSPGVSVLSTQTWEMRRKADVVAKFGVPPRALGDLLALMGDKSDNVPGCPGVGPKRGAELIGNYDTLANIFARAKANISQCESTGATPGFVDAALRDNEGAVMLARELVCLRFDAPIIFEEIYSDRVTKSLAEEEPMTITHEKIAAAVLAEKRWQELPGENLDRVRRDEAMATAIATIEPQAVAFELAFEPSTSAIAMAEAKLLFDSRLYAKFPNVQSLWAVIVRGREMGLKMGEALDSFHVISGSPVASAQLLIAKAKSHPDCEYLQCVETTEASCTWVTKNRRNPEPTTLKYTIDDAKLAGMTGGQWPRRPKEMLRKTCGVQLARLEYPDAALGLYCAEEMGV